FALGAVSRVHETIGYVAGGRQDEQPFSIEVETPYRQPLAHLEFGQTSKDICTAIGVIVADNLASRLMVKNNPRRFLAIGTGNQPPVYPNLVVFPNPLPNMGRLTVDRDTPRNDELFHFPPGTDTRFGQHLVQFGH